MSAMDYLINSVLVLLVVRQILGTRLTLQALLLPVAIVAGAVVYYHPSVPTAGHDVVLDVTLGAAGLVLGALCGLATHLRRGADGVPVAKAGAVAAALWVAGIGARMAFAFASTHGAGPALLRFSAAHQITSGDAWVAALFAMALAEVITRVAVLRLRASRLPAATSQSPVVTSQSPAAISQSAAVTSQSSAHVPTAA
jgi:hypothetical protein